MKDFRKFKKNQNNSDDDYENDGESGFSMSSSMMYRNEQLTLLDDQFDKVLDDYDDEEIGELDGEDEEVLGEIDIYDSNVENAHIETIFDEFLESAKVIGSKHRLVTRKADEDLDSIRNVLKEDAQNIVDKFGEEESLKRNNVKIHLPEPRKRNEWDVESVLSMNSNVYNRPAIIKEISKGVGKITITRGMPTIVQTPEPKIQKSSPLVFSRNKNESNEEKKERKQQIKEQKRERRQIKKSNTLNFKDEKFRQAKIEPNHKFQAQTIALH